MSSQVPRDFKGICIPREIWLHPEISITEKALWAEIDSLYSEEHGGCYASNEYFSKIFGTNERNIRRYLENLKKFLLIEQVAFDGRTRVLIACKIDDWAARSKMTGETGIHWERKLFLGKELQKGGTYVH